MGRTILERRVLHVTSRPWSWPFQCAPEGARLQRKLHWLSTLEDDAGIRADLAVNFGNAGLAVSHWSWLTCLL